MRRDKKNVLDCTREPPCWNLDFFSRLSAKKTYSVDQSSEEEKLERNEPITEKAMEEMSNEITKALALQHPIL